MPVEEYLRAFKWDGVHFVQDKNLEVLGLNLQKRVKDSEDQVKKQHEKIQGLKTHLNQLTKKKDDNMTKSDLADYIYENKGGKIRKEFFVNTHYGPHDSDPSMTTVLVVVNKKKEDFFRENYEEMLIKFNEADIEAWTKKTRMGLANDLFEKTLKEEEEKAK